MGNMGACYHLLCSACESMPLTFYPVSLAAGKQYRGTVTGLKELGFLASVCDTVQIPQDLFVVLIAFRLYTIQLYLIASSLFSFPGKHLNVCTVFPFPCQE